MAEYPNVYTDFSFIGTEPDFYRTLSELIVQYAPVQEESLKKRILFGSDFMINLIEIDSYYDYIARFSDSELSSEQKHAFCSENPERFLFE